MICPLAGTDLFQVQAPVALDGEIDLSPAGLTALIGARTGRSNIAVRSVSWSSVYAMNARLADRYRVGRVFIAGDAAHVHPPTGGQGLNTSVQDAYNLGWKLASVLAGAPERCSTATRMSADRSRRTCLSLDTPARRSKAGHHAARSRSASARPRLSQLIIEHARFGELHSAGGRSRTRCSLPRAGGATDTAVHAFQGPHWTLLGYEPHNRPSAIAGVRIVTIGAGHEFVDEGGDIVQAYGIEPGQWVLVRPDGYIAGIFPLTDWSRSFHATSRMCCRPARPNGSKNHDPAFRPCWILRSFWFWLSRRGLRSPVSIKSSVIPAYFQRRRDRFQLMDTVASLYFVVEAVRLRD
jgi:hypothetical protein